MNSDLVSTHDVCEAAVNYVLTHVNTIQYILHSIEDITGQSFERHRIKCISPPAETSRPEYMENVSAGYMWRTLARQGTERGDVVLLENAMVLPRSGALRGPLTDAVLEKHFQKVLTNVEKNLRHELIHAFDDTRGYVDPSDCLHQACSEIRAARLSGDCFAGEEMRRWRLNFSSGSKACVRRRSITAVESNPICRGFSARAVEKMFPRCYGDYEPYTAPIYAMGSYGNATFSNGTLPSRTTSSVSS